MSVAGYLAGVWANFLAAVQFLTRIPVPARPYEADSLARSVKFFPLVGMLIGGVGAAIHHVIVPHLPRLVAAFCVVVYLVLITGGLHEDGLADAADGFGGGSSRDRILLILRDSRIGSYGGIALALGLIGRVLLIATLPLGQVTQYLIAAHVLCRWTTLPLSYFLLPARVQETMETDGLGARIARITSLNTLIVGTIFSFAVTAVLLRGSAVAALMGAVLLTTVTGVYYRRRIGGATGDCFGATNQLAEIGVYLCGVWTR